MVSLSCSQNLENSSYFGRVRREFSGNADRSRKGTPITSRVKHGRGCFFLFTFAISTPIFFQLRG